MPQLTNLGYQMFSIDGTTQVSSLELAINAAPHFDLSKDKALAILRELAGVVHGQWWLHAKAQAVSDALRHRLQSCFQRQKEIIGGAAFGL